MMLTGLIRKTGGSIPYYCECAAIGAFTQGRNRNDALAQLADCIETLVNDPKLKVSIFETAIENDTIHVYIEANDPGVLAAYLLRHLRKKSKMTLAQVAEKLGSSSTNSYGAYETGAREPTLTKLYELIRVVAPEYGIAIGPRKPARVAGERAQHKPVPRPDPTRAQKAKKVTQPTVHVDASTPGVIRRR